VDIATSLSPYLVVYDGRGDPLAGAARLDGTIPKPPLGVLTSAVSGGQNRVTWQPRPGVRSATVVVATGRADAPFVFAGRSLREVEKRVDNLSLLTGVMWLLTLGASLLVVAGLEVLFAHRRPAV
jgi:hypothetical protein